MASADRRRGDIAVDEDSHALRVNAMISSVLMRTSPRQRMCATRRSPRPGRLFRRAGLMRTALPSSSNSTSVSGTSPVFSRRASGIVTWPLDVTRIAFLRS
jgi:hypothetical protein